MNIYEFMQSWAITSSSRCSWDEERSENRCWRGKIMKYTAANFTDFIIFNNLLQNRLIPSEWELCRGQSRLTLTCRATGLLWDKGHGTECFTSLSTWIITCVIKHWQDFIFSYVFFMFCSNWNFPWSLSGWVLLIRLLWACFQHRSILKQLSVDPIILLLSQCSSQSMKRQNLVKNAHQSSKVTSSIAAAVQPSEI